MSDVCNYLFCTADCKYIGRNLSSFLFILIKSVFNNRGNSKNIVISSKINCFICISLIYTLITCVLLIIINIFSS